MLAITNLENQTEPLTDYKELKVEEEVFNADTGNMTLSFVALNSKKNKHAYPLLEEESLIEYEGHEYRVKGLSENRFRKTVTAPHIFFDLVDDRKDTINGGTKTLNNAVAWVLASTGWTYENVNVTGSQLLPNFGEDNLIKLLKVLCAAFDCEIEIMPGRHLRFVKRIGKDDDFQFRYKHNIKALRKSVDTTNLKTVIKGYGGNGLEVTYTSPNVTVFGERHAEPIKDDRFTVPESLVERIKRELVDTPEVSIELEEIDLGEPKGLGDSVWLIYEPLGIEFQTRIMARSRYPKTPNKNTVTLGTASKKFTDLLTETNIRIDENNKQVQSRIDQTNDRISLEVEEIDGALASFEVTVGRIESRVSGPGGLESQITQLSDSIESRVTSEEARSIFRQEADSFTFDADQINFYGHVFGQTATFTGTIRTEENAEVGHHLYLGRFQSGQKHITFNNVARISAGLGAASGDMEISSDYLRLQSFRGIETYPLGTGGGNLTVRGNLTVTGSHNISSVGYATNAGTANNASRLGNLLPSSYARSSHSHDGEYVRVAGSAGNLGISIYNNEQMVIWRGSSVIGRINFD